MNQSELPDTTPSATGANALKRVILSMGGKGGVGKTAIMTAEWFDRMYPDVAESGIVFTCVSPKLRNYEKTFN